MRSIWNGSINFGMVTIPAKLYTAADDSRVPFHQYHAECNSRIQMPKWCPVCERKVEAAEIKRGYEINATEHIILEEADFLSLPLKSLKQIEVMEFVDGTRIDARAYSGCYFLSCDDAGIKAFTLLLEAMQTVNQVAIAKLTYRDREHLSAIRPYDGIMLLQTLHYASELRPYEELKPRQLAIISDKEREMALALVKAMTGQFELSTYHDEYREALEQMIEAKLSGGTITIPEVKAAPVSDVADALIQSLKLVEAKAK